MEESASGKTLRIWIEHKHVSVQARVMDTCKLVKNKKHVKPRLPSVRSIGRHVCSLAFAIISIEKRVLVRNHSACTGRFDAKATANPLKTLPKPLFAALPTQSERSKRKQRFLSYVYVACK